MIQGRMKSTKIVPGHFLSVFCTTFPVIKKNENNSEKNQNIIQKIIEYNNSYRK